MSKKIIKIALLSLLTFSIGFFLVSRKENLDLDETYTYGLANSSFQLEVEDFKEYSGEELLSAYAMVKPTERFDIKNVFFNQEMDTHPPLYYMLVNAVCSFNAGTFSMWYGLIINVILLVLLFWEMRYLFTLIIKDNIFSTIFTLLSFFLYGFTNEIVFTRMYVMLTVVSMAFIILIIDYISILNDNVCKAKNINSPIVRDNKEHNDKIKRTDISFIIKFYIICIIGILTQYHFMIIAGFFSLILAIYLIKNKNIKMFIVMFCVGILSIVTSYIIFPGMLTHFFGGASLHALTNNQNAPFLQKFIEMAETLKEAFFGDAGIIIYGIVIAICIAILFIQRFKCIKKCNVENRNNHNLNNNIINSKIINSKIKNNITIKNTVGIKKENSNLSNTEKNSIMGTSNNSVILGMTLREPLKVRIFKNKFLKCSLIRGSLIKYIIENEQLKYYLYFLLCSIIYFILIVLTVQFTFMRYLYNIYPLILILLLSPVYIVLKNIKKAFAVVSLILLLALCITSNFKSQADSLNIGDEIFHQYLIQNKNKKVICLYHSVDKYGNENTMGGTSKWKLPYPLYLLRDMENVTFVDTGYIKKLKMSTSKSICGYDDIFLVIYTTQDDNTLINEVMIKNNVTKIEKTYFTNYIHIYHLHN